VTDHEPYDCSGSVLVDEATEHTHTYLKYKQLRLSCQMLPYKQIVTSAFNVYNG